MPVTQPGLMYPVLPKIKKPRKKDYICPKCGSTNRSRLLAVSDGPNGKLFMFKCDWDDRQWFVSARLIVNEILQDQIKRFSEMTKKSGKEVGGLLVRNKDGVVVMDMEQMGEDRSVSMEPTRKLQPGEEILGTWHSHPISDKPSYWDVATFLRDKWEKISCVSGAEGTLTVMVKTDKTTQLPGEEVGRWEEEHREKETPLEELGEKYAFLVYQGPPDKLQLISGDKKTTVTLEKLIKGVKGVKRL